MSKYSDDCREEHIEERKMNKSKAISAVLAFVIAAMTLIGLAFSLVVVEFEYEWFEEVVGSENGFQLLTFTSEYITAGYAWGIVVIGILCLFQLFVSLVSMIAIVVYAVRKHPFAYRLQLISSIVCLVFNFLYMLEGITYSSITDATYPDHVSAHTLAYIPFLIVTGLFVVYLIYVQNSNHPMQQVADSAMESGARFERNVNGAIYRLDGGMVKVLYVYGDHLTLQAKKNLRSWVTHDFFRGTKEIYYSDILGVQYKDAGALIAGYIQFETATSHAKSNFDDENSFTFDASYITNEQAKEVAEFVRGKVRETRRSQGQTVVQAAPLSAADELKKYKDLLDAGVINQEEFDMQKEKILK